MKRVATINLCFLLISGCGKIDRAKPQDILSGNMIFKGEDRSSMSPTEASSILRFRNNCTGFLIKNSANKILAATARHCLRDEKDKLEQACSSGYIKFFNYLGSSFSCERIVLDDPKHDTFIVELKSSDHPSKLNLRPLKLTSVLPYFGIPLEMLGFPGDSVRLGNPTKTGNCSITGFRHKVEDRYYDKGVPNNCSTWGGNSGGPIIIENSELVVGVPGVYSPNDNSPRNKFGATQAYHEDMGLLIERNKKLLLDEGIEIVELSTNASIDLAFLGKDSISDDALLKLYDDSFKHLNSIVIEKKFNFLKDKLAIFNNTDSYNILHLALRSDNLELLKLSLQLNNASELLRVKSKNKQFAPYHFISNPEEFTVVNPDESMILDESSIGSLLEINLNHYKNIELQDLIFQRHGSSLMTLSLFTDDKLWKTIVNQSIPTELRAKLIEFYFSHPENIRLSPSKLKSFYKRLGGNNCRPQASSLGLISDNKIALKLDFICETEVKKSLAAQISVNEFKNGSEWPLVDENGEQLLLLRFTDGIFKL